MNRKSRELLEEQEDTSMKIEEVEAEEILMREEQACFCLCTCNVN